jgi:hypothetical protein
VRRVIKHIEDADNLATLLKSRKLPCTVDVQDGAKRSNDQNALAHKWFKEIAEQLGDQTPAEVKAMCKLHFGVPILRAENEAFRATYDETVMPLSYEQKLRIMQVFDFPVTRLMTTKQETQFLDEVSKFAAQHGIVLTMPELRQ